MRPTASLPKVNYYTASVARKWNNHLDLTCEMPHLGILLGSIFSGSAENFVGSHAMEVLNSVVVESGFLGAFGVWLPEHASGRNVAREKSRG